MIFNRVKETMENPIFKTNYVTAKDDKENQFGYIDLENKVSSSKISTIIVDFIPPSSS